MKLLLDMNLSPVWVEVLHAAGHEAVHWVDIGARNDDDEVIFEWAGKNKFTIITLDLDFGTLLAKTRATHPSVIQIRREDAGPERLGVDLLSLIWRYAGSLEAGALIVLDESKIRLRILPLR